MTFHMGKRGTDTSIDHLILTFLLFFIQLHVMFKYIKKLKVKSQERCECADFQV